MLYCHSRPVSEVYKATAYPGGELVSIAALTPIPCGHVSSYPRHGIGAFGAKLHQSEYYLGNDCSWQQVRFHSPNMAA